ncbi:MAG: RluA family pseudouridine synthase [Candidatus Izemoplasmatales bacterium]|nr:RluA family pseudouridine synthase [Candidatus Izemoplasmatales bacterium]MDD4355298.1 RluA family pseudouridine synthase [Candidatus Izemoplasmatales bacterium]MDY0373962.1 RluA family pseudouridine synthase [Candidatus Izemoplasmatales bacterium]
MKNDREDIIEYQIGPENPLDRLDKVMAIIFTDYSRTTIQKMITSGLVTVNERLAKASQKVKIGDNIAFTELPFTEWDIIPENLPLDIVYEDDEVLVVNKPSGIVVHPAAGHHQGTLVNALLYHIQHLSGSKTDLRPGIVHRIDKDTSGLLMVAKTDLAHQVLQAELKEKITKRIYYALVNGVILNQFGTIDAPIGRDPRDRKKMGIVPEGRHAVTHFTVEERFLEHSLLECRLETGRTHQIRVHLAYIGHPLAGDPVYGYRKDASSFGQYLHAGVLGFTHPITQKWLEFSSPLPPLFQERLTTLREETKKKNAF